MRRKRGIFMIGVLLITLLVAMFIGAAISLSPMALAREQKDQDWRLARSAVLSGADYALARLKADPHWRAEPNYQFPSDPDFFVQENQGNVVGLVRTGGGAYSQFRFRFNWENGTPTPDPDQLPNSSSPLNYPYASLNNADLSTDFVLPAVGSKPALTVPARSLFLAIEGRAGKACGALSPSNFNPNLNGSWGLTTVNLRAVYHITNPGQIVDPAVGMSGGQMSANFGTGTPDKLKLKSKLGQTTKLRSKANLSVTGGDSTANLESDKPALYRVPTLATPVTSGMNNVARGSDETPSDNFYKMTYLDAKKADGTNTLRAGTYVWQDDGSLHYYDMSPKDYITYIQANPLDPGQVKYSQADGIAALGTGVNVTSSGSGSSMQGKIRIHQDTAVTAATNTTELGILPQKGAAEKPAVAGAGTGTTSDFRSWLLSGAMTQNGSSQFTLSSNPAVVQFFNDAATWGNSHGYGSYGGNNWNLGSVSLQVGIGSNNVNLPPGQWGSFQDAVNGYLGSGDASVLVNLPLLQAQLVVAQPGGSSNGEVPASTSQVNPKNLEVELKPGGSATSAVLSSDHSISLGTKVKGQGASIVSGEDIRLVGLGVNLSANPNANEGVSLFAGKDVFISTFDSDTSKFKDAAFKGVIYAQGNIQVVLGHNSVVPGDWGKFKVEGSMIAYGGDPATQTPGQGAGGSIDMISRGVEMTFDPSYLTNLMNTLPNNLTYGRWLWELE